MFAFPINHTLIDLFREYEHLLLFYFIIRQNYKYFIVKFGHFSLTLSENISFVYETVKFSASRPAYAVSLSIAE